MTSVSSYSSPLQALEAQLSSSVSAGTIKSADKNALTTALTELDSSLNASRSDSSTGKPGDVKQKVDDLIAKQVSDGKLTSDQANELKSVFQQTFSQGGGGAADGASGAGGHHGPGGPGGPGGPPPGPPPDSNASSSDSSTSSSSSTSGTTTSDLLQQFLKSLQDQLNASASTYGASGTGSSTSSSSSSLLVDYTT